MFPARARRPRNDRHTHRSGQVNRATNADSMAGKPKTGEIYSRYQNRLKKADAMDFDDLLRLPDDNAASHLRIALQLAALAAVVVFLTGAPRRLPAWIVSPMSVCCWIVMSPA